MTEPLDLGPLKAYYGALVAEVEERGPQLGVVPFYATQILALVAEVERLRSVVWFNQLALDRRFTSEGSKPPEGWSIRPDEESREHIRRLYEEFVAL